MRMMKAFGLIGGVLLAISAIAESPERPALIEAQQSRPRPIVMTDAEQWSVKSRSGRTFEISILLPRASAPEAGYPALYVLDPNTSFATLADTVRNHEAMFGPAVVVGIGYMNDEEVQNRRFDMTPPTDLATLPKYLPGGWGAVGGADTFLSFLLDELRPLVGKRLPIDSSKQALFGHSLGGLFVLHTLFRRPEAFDTYIAGSPAFWWGKGVIMKELPAFRARQMRSAERRRLLITVGALESGINPEEHRAMKALNAADPDAIIRDANVVGNARALAGELQPLSTHGLQVVFTTFEDETHNSVIPAYLSRGARFTLGGWYH